LSPELLAYLETAFGEILAAWRCKRIESGGEPDHVHLLINNLKTASARRARNRFADHLAPFCQKPLFWSRAYFVASVGGATSETVRAYVDAQGTAEHARKSAAKAKSKPARQTPFWPVGFA
jgi:putative transposase